MTDKVFVPVTDDAMESTKDPGAVLVPYHPDRPCWRLDPPDPDRCPGTETRPGGNSRYGSNASRAGGSRDTAGNR